MAKVNSSGDGTSIYGQVPELGGQASKALKDAMSNANEFVSNKINGPTESKDSEYDPEEGK